MKAPPRVTPAQKARLATLKKRLLALRRKTLKTESALYENCSHDYVRAAGKLLKSAGMRKARKLIHAARAEWHAGNLQGDGDVGAWHERKRDARSRLRRQLVREVPNFRQWGSLRRGHLKAYGKIARKHFKEQTALQLPLGWNVAGTPPAAVQQLRRFGPPFRVSDVNGTGDGGFLEKDESSVQQNGIIVNDLVLDHDEDTAIILGIYGLPGRARYTAWAACGLSYTMPLSGRLYIAPELANIYNHVTMSLEDSFGLSDGKLHVTINLDIVVAPFQRPLIHLPKILFTHTLLSEGDDEFDIIPDMEPFYTWERSTNESFAMGEVVEVLVSAEVQVQSELDDMQSHVEAVLAWELRRLGIGVIA